MFLHTISLIFQSNSFRYVIEGLKASVGQLALVGAMLDGSNICVFLQPSEGEASHGMDVITACLSVVL